MLTEEKKEIIAEQLTATANELVKIEGIEIEQCGSWLWISGDTFPVKDQLKSLGCRFSRKKSLWYWHSNEEERRYHKSQSMSHIRSRYGSYQLEKEQA